MAWVVIGLGNPGAEYKDTRHNAGRMAVEFFAKQHGATLWKAHSASKSLTAGATIGKNIVALVLPETFMNKSGSAAAKFVKSVKAAEKLIVVYDELDLPIGKMKVSFDRGSGGHKGLESIIRAVKSKKFTRIRIGISGETAAGETKKPHGEKEVEKHILGAFRPHEMDELKKVFKKASEAIECAISDGPVIAMNRFN